MSKSMSYAHFSFSSLMSPHDLHSLGTQFYQARSKVLGMQRYTVSASKNVTVQSEREARKPYLRGSENWGQGLPMGGSIEETCFFRLGWGDCRQAGPWGRGSCEWGRAGFRDCDLCRHTGPILRKGLCLLQCSDVTFKFFTFGQGTPRFHFALGSTDYVASPGGKEYIVERHRDTEKNGKLRHGSGFSVAACKPGWEPDWRKS